MAHEQLDGQAWANCTDDIPTTDPEFPLANLDISDPEHPILRKPEAPKAQTEAVEPSPSPANPPSSPGGSSSHADSASHLSGRTSTSSISSLSDGSWTLDVQSAMMRVSRQISVSSGEDGDGSRYVMRATESGEQA
jgi:hypothetical protein